MRDGNVVQGAERTRDPRAATLAVRVRKLPRERGRGLWFAAGQSARAERPAAITRERRAEREPLLLRGRPGHARRSILRAVSRPIARFLCVLAALASATVRARADEPICETGSFHEAVDIEVQPAYGATGVARNAPIIVRYLTDVDLDALEASLGPDEALVSLLRETGGSGAPRETVAGDAERLDARTVAFIPAQRLAANTKYHPLVAKAGFDSAAFAELRFQTGRIDDEVRPDLALDADGIRFATEPIPEACTGPEGRVRVAVTFPPAVDDGDELSIEYFLYLTRGVAVDAPELRDRARSDGGDVRMSLELTREQAREIACVAVRAVDGVGRPAESEPEACFDPIEGSHFRPCAVAGPGSGASDTGTGPAGWLVACAAVLVLRCRTRPRARARMD